MKEEEIRPIAENYVEEYCHLPDGEYTDGSLVCAGIGTALIVSRQLEKRIEELTEWLNEASDGKLKLQMLRADLVSKIGNQKKLIEELEEKISILLSCKNCPDNKGGLLCQKEYEGKCLSQKIQYIKELKEENAELKDKLNNLSKVAEVRLANWQKYEQENAELKRDKSELCNAINEEGKACVKLNEKLSKAKGFIEKLLIVSCNSEILIQYPNCKEVLEARVALELFLQECE